MAEAPEAKGLLECRPSQLPCSSHMCYYPCKSGSTEGGRNFGQTVASKAEGLTTTDLKVILASYS